MKIARIEDERDTISHVARIVLVAALRSSLAVNCYRVQYVSMPTGQVRSTYQR